MTRHDGADGMDAGQVGRAFALPAELRTHIAAMVAGMTPVRAAAAAGWAGLEELRLVTAALNGSAAAVRPAGGPRVASSAVAGEQSSFEAGALPVSSGAVAIEVAVASGSSREAESERVAVSKAEAVENSRQAPRRGEEASWGVGELRTPAIAATELGSRSAGGVGRDTTMSHLGAESFPQVVHLEANRDTVAREAIAPFVERLERGGKEADGESAGDPAMRRVDGGDALAVVVAAADAPVMGVRALRSDVGSVLRERARLEAAPEVQPPWLDGGWEHGSVFPGGGRQSGGGSPNLQSSSVGYGAAGLGQPVAPQPPERDGGSDAAGGGAVLLDGRLVGQWLSERMARDASRPGAGTTFFDPRQSPAWTPSGAV